jgi:hypothetical protein
MPSTTPEIKHILRSASCVGFGGAEVNFSLRQQDPKEPGSCCVNRMTAAADWRVRHVGDNCYHEAEDSGAAEAENTMRRCVSQTQGGGEYGILRSCWGFHLKETYQSFHVGLVQRFDIPGRIKARADYV